MFVLVLIAKSGMLKNCGPSEQLRTVNNLLLVSITAVNLSKTDKSLT